MPERFEFNVSVRIVITMAALKNQKYGNSSCWPSVGYWGASGGIPGYTTFCITGTFKLLKNTSHPSYICSQNIVWTTVDPSLSIPLVQSMQQCLGVSEYYNLVPRRGKCTV